MGNDPAPGWYDDPAGSGKQRWWDGSTWTEQVQSPEPEPQIDAYAPPAAADRRDDPADGSAPPRRRRRARALVAAALAIAAIGGGVAAVLLLTESSVVASDDRLPDLRERPEVAWSLDLDEPFQDLYDAIVRAGGWEAEQIQSGDAGFVRDSSYVATLDVADSRAIVAPTFQGISHRVYGVDTSSGDITWTSEPLTSGGPSAGSLDCAPVESPHVACLASRWEESTASVLATLYVIDGGDGSITGQVEMPRSANSHEFLYGPEARAALVLHRTERRRELTRYATDGESLWSVALPPADGVAFLTHSDRVYLQGNDENAGWSRVVDLETGQDRDDFLPRPPRGDDWASFHLWGDEVLWSHNRAGSSRRTISMLDDAEERWWWTGDERLMNWSVVEPAAPVLLLGGDDPLVRAVNPDDGTERWQYRHQGGGVWAPLVAQDRVVMRDSDRIVVLDAATGDRFWSRTLTDDPTVFEVGATILYELVDGYRLQAIDIESGDERWSFTAPGPATHARLQTFGGELVLVSTDGIHALR